MGRSSGKTSVSKSHLNESVVGDHASLTRVGGNYEVHNHYGSTAGVQLRPRDPARHWLPSTHDPCIGRNEILQRIWQEAPGVEFNGSLGIGRTNLTRHTAYAAKDDWEAVYYTDRAEAVGEILRGILSCFYEWDAGAIPSDHSVAERLREHRPLVVLDNDALRRDSIEQVANLLGPGSFVIYSSTTRQLAAGSTVIVLPGLDPDSAIDVVELRLRRTVDEKEREALRQFVAAVDGHPFKVISAVLGLGRSRITLDALTAEAQRQPDLADDDRYVLEILRCLDGAAIPIEELEVLCETRGISASAVIDRLGRAGLIERHSPRVSIREEPGAHSVDEVVLRDVLRHFATAADRAGHWRAPGLGAALRRLLAVLRRRQQRAARDQLADTTEAILGGLRTGAARGTWEEVHQASMALIPAFGAAGLPGAWDAATSRAVEATAELGRPLDQARALQERGCYLAVVHGPKEAAPAFSAALAVADKAVDAPELRSLIARNLEEVAPERGQEAAVEPTPLVDPARPLLQPRRAGPWLEFVLRHRGELLAILSGGAVLAISHRRRGLAVAISITLALYLGFVRHRPRSTDGQAESEANEKTYVDNRVDA